MVALEYLGYFFRVNWYATKDISVTTLEEAKKTDSFKHGYFYLQEGANALFKLSRIVKRTKHELKDTNDGIDRYISTGKNVEPIVTFMEITQNPIQLEVDTETNKVRHSDDHEIIITEKFQ